MFTRRDILKSALLLPAAPALMQRAALADAPAAAAVPAQAAAAIEVFEDFESGTWANWTLEGDCWGDAPATAALFHDKITGFGGKYFACTLHPRKGTSATGKATSREFTITKPYITFKIGGGNYPGEACLNLVVDGKVVRSATGNGLPELVDGHWDMLDLLGTTAKIEIIDATTRVGRGYIMVDDICLANYIAESDNIIGGQPKFAPRFLNHYKPFERLDLSGNSVFPFARSQYHVQRMINGVIQAMRSDDMGMPPVGQRDISSLSATIRRKVDEILPPLAGNRLTPFTRDWMIAEAVAEFVRLNVFFDEDIAQHGGDLAKQYCTSENILARSEPGAVCWGLSILVRDLAREAGLDCHFVNGNSRWLGDPAPKQSDRNHGLACFTLKDGTTTYDVPADVGIVRGTMQKPNARLGRGGLKWNPPVKVFSQFILPRTLLMWEIFLARFNADIGPHGSISGDAQSTYLMLDMNYDEWASTPTADLNHWNKLIVDTEESFR